MCRLKCGRRPPDVVRWDPEWFQLSQRIHYESSNGDNPRLVAAGRHCSSAQEIKCKQNHLPGRFVPVAGVWVLKSGVYLQNLHFRDL
jgi:hypothetical protein